MSPSPFPLGTTEGARRREEAMGDPAGDSGDGRSPSQPVRDPEEWAFLAASTHSIPSRPASDQHTPTYWPSPARTTDQPLSLQPPAHLFDSTAKSCDPDSPGFTGGRQLDAKEKTPESNTFTAFTRRHNREGSPSTASEDSRRSRRTSGTNSSAGSFIELPKYRPTASMAPSFGKNLNIRTSLDSARSVASRAWVNGEPDGESVTQAIAGLRKDMRKLRFGMQRVAKRLDRLLDKL